MVKPPLFGPSDVGTLHGVASGHKEPPPMAMEREQHRQLHRFRDNSNDMLRPCLFLDEPALFHRWVEISDVVEPSPMVGGHPGGVVRRVYALIEKSNGEPVLASLGSVKFTDSMVQNNASYESLRAFYERITSLHDCNDCEKKYSCDYRPNPGGQTRINCPLWVDPIK